MTADLDQLLVLRVVASNSMALAAEYEEVMTPWQRAGLRILGLGAENHRRQIEQLDAQIAALGGGGPRCA